MITEANKEIVRSFNRAIEDADLNQLSLLTTEDAEFWISPTTIGSGTYEKATWLQLMSGMFEQLAAPMTLRMRDFTAEDDRVSLTMVGSMNLKNGRIYNGHWHMLYFLRDGRISALREYLDTYHVAQIFGPPDSGDPPSG